MAVMRSWWNIIELFSFALVWSLWALTTANVNNCWFDAPLIQFVHQMPNISVERDDTHIWIVNAVLEWEAPREFVAGDRYILSYRNLDESTSYADDDLCTIKTSDVVVNETSYTFSQLGFGFMYEFQIFAYRPKRGKAIYSNSQAIQTPDCFQATEDPEFCSQEDVQYSGAPTAPNVDSICRNTTNSLLEVTISWGPPIQINGALSFFKIQLSSADFPPSFDAVARRVPFNPLLLEDDGGVEDTLTVTMQENSNFSSERLSAKISGLESEQMYFVTVVPYVKSPVNNETNVGLELAMNIPTTSEFLNNEQFLKDGELPICEPIQEKNLTTVSPSSSESSKTTVSSKIANKQRTAKGSRRQTKYRTNKPHSIPHVDDSDPMTLTSIVLVISATILVTILIVAILILGVHYMRGIPPDVNQSKLNYKPANQGNGEVVAEDIVYGAPLRENV